MATVVKDYTKFSGREFAMDEYFQSWILQTNKGTDAYWKLFLEDHPEKAEAVEEARDILNHFGFENYSLSEEDVSSLWKNIQSSSKEKIIDNNPKKQKKIFWYAASAAFFLISIGAYYQYVKVDKVDYQTSYGETRTITLPDSSTVILNANSHISFANDWTKQASREIWIEGEAYFSVLHKSDHQPFRVKTLGGVSIEVLGTKFNVYHRATTKVVLNSGQISLSFPIEKNEKVILMKPGEMVVCEKDKYSQKQVDPTAYNAWTENKIVFNQTSLQEMVQVAKDNYGLVIEVKPAQLLEQTISGSMPIGNAESFVKQLAKAFQLKVVRGNKKFLLTE